MSSVGQSSAPGGTARSARSPVGAILPWLLAAVSLLVLPFIFSTSSAITIMIQIAITVVFALSYNMLLGQGGMLSFGHAVYMGLGGFFCVHLMNFVETDGWWLPLPLLPLFGGVFGLLFAVIVGSFSTRRAGTVFAMISLGIGELIAACSIIIVVFFGGEEGISADRTMGPVLAGLDFATQREVYYLTAVWLMLATIGMYLFSRTPAGRLANAVRDNAERAEFVGYSQRTVRFISFCASGFFAGIAGGLFAINYEILTEENLNLVSSGTILLATFLGGVGFFVGPIIGAIVFTLLQTVLSLYTEIWQLYLGALFLLTVMFFPSGLTGLLAMHRTAFRLGRLQSLAVPYGKALVPGAVGLFGLVALLEILFHFKHAPQGSSEMVLFGIDINTQNALPWLLSVAALAIGLVLAIRYAPILKQAWDKANTVAAPAEGS